MPLVWERHFDNVLHLFLLLDYNSSALKVRLWQLYRSDMLCFLPLKFAWDGKYSCCSHTKFCGSKSCLNYKSRFWQKLVQLYRCKRLWSSQLNEMIAIFLYLLATSCIHSKRCLSIFGARLSKLPWFCSAISRWDLTDFFGYWNYRQHFCAETLSYDYIHIWSLFSLLSLTKRCSCRE